jgi:nitroreductase
MEFREVVEERRSIRKFFPKPVEMEKIGELIHMGMKAPSIGDLQPWNFIIVTKAQKLQDIADACPYERWLYQAPILIVICSLGDKAESYYPGKGRLWASQSCAAAAENISLGAVDFELSTCWVTSFETYKIKEVLHIPDGIEPEIMLALGYPDEEPKPKRFPPIHTNTFFNDYGQANTDVALFKRDYGSFVRDRLEDLKTRAAYETAPRGGLRMTLDDAKTKLSGLFRKKKSAPTTHTPSEHEHAPGHHHHQEEDEDESAMAGEYADETYSRPRNHNSHDAHHSHPHENHKR